MTGFFRWISTKLRMIVLTMNLIVVLVLGSALDGTFSWRMVLVLVVNILCMGVMGHGLEVH